MPIINTLLYQNIFLKTGGSITKIVNILCWLLLGAALFTAAQFFIVAQLSFGIFFFCVACSISPPLLSWLGKKKINQIIPFSIVVIVFIIFFSTSFLISQSTLLTKVSQEQTSQGELQAEAFFQETKKDQNSMEENVPNDQIRYVVKDIAPIPTGSVIVIKSEIEPFTKPYQHPKEATIRINETGFNPESIVVPRGTLVTWTNEFKRRHILQIVNNTGGYKNFATSGKLELGDSFSYIFNQDGIFAYQDVLFNWRGKITVVPEEIYRKEYQT